LIAYAPALLAEVAAVAERHDCPLAVLGVTGGERLTLVDSEERTLVDVAVSAVAAQHGGGLERALGVGRG
jgi:phosphoribosylformylglycinamidine (FGAM) synthase-like enzyme